jgi:hypothetical protein
MSWHKEAHEAMSDAIESYLTPEQRATWLSLDSPAQIQAFLDAIPYSAEDANRSPLQVLQDRQAHCLDGALFAAAALRRLGRPPIIVDLLPEPGLDDDHVLAIFKRDGFYGALAKSNFTGLRYREPIHRTFRELVLSYFEDFFNVNGVKTLRAYTAAINLATYDRLGWMTRSAGADAIEKRLKELKRIPLLPDYLARDLLPMDERAYRAGMLGVNVAGVYKPPR